MRGRWHVGPGAASLCLIVVIVCLAILSLLTWMSARADLQLTRRTVEMTRDYYEADARAQHRLCQVDQALLLARERARKGEDYFGAVDDLLPGEVSREGDCLRFTQQAEAGRQLEVTLRMNGPQEEMRYQVLNWALTDTTIWEEDGWME